MIHFLAFSKIQLNKNKQILFSIFFNFVDRAAMSMKKVTVLIDNRVQDDGQYGLEGLKPEMIDLKGSAFKATEIGIDEAKEKVFQQMAIIGELERKVRMLEGRVKKLQADGVEINRQKKKKRRKASQIVKSFKCPQQSCQRIYGSETSLKNHMKIKHIKKQTQSPE